MSGRGGKYVRGPARNLRPDPGPVPEAAALQAHSEGLGAVLEQIRRETLGAVSPGRQLLAVEAILQDQHESLANVMSAARTNGRVLSAADTFRFVFALSGRIKMEHAWLLLAWRFKRLPARGRKDLSVAASREKRDQVLERIRLDRRIAEEMMDNLALIAPPGSAPEGVLESIRFELLCVEMSATRHARFSASEPVPLPQGELEAMLAELDRIRGAPGFEQRPSGQRDLFWGTAAVVYDDLGDDDGILLAARERRALTVDDPDGHAFLLVELLDMAESAQEKLELLDELGRLASTFDPGPLFSRARIGRVSVLRDAVWSAATSVAAQDPVAAETVDEALVCHRNWLFGDPAPMGERTIRVISDWAGGGHGRVRWEHGGADHVREFELGHELVERFFLDREAMRPADRGAGPALARFLDDVLGPLVAEAAAAKDEVRIQTGGSVAQLPLLMAKAAGDPLGADPRVAWAHPNRELLPRAAPRGSFDLLVVDDCFGQDSADVRSTVALASEDCRILRFDSRPHGTELSHQVLADALGSASRALFFSHVETPALNAYAAAVPTGPAGRFDVEAFAALDLDSLEELALVGCASGRPNLFVGDVSVAHAAAMAGARDILYSLWPIRAVDGSAFASELAKSVAEQGVAGFLADRYRGDRSRAGAFAIMRP